MAKDTGTSQVSMPEIPSRFTLTRIIIAVIAITIYWWSFAGTGLNPVEIYKGMPGLWDLLRHMFPPDTDILLSLWTPFIETLQIGILASLIGSVIAVPVGFLAAANMSPKIVYHSVRLVLNVFRGVSEIIWALLFVVAVGLGPMPGVLALIIFCVGVMGKLIAEAVEAVDPPLVAEIAEDDGHHPDLHLEGYRNMSIELWTHAIGGLSENDFILAAKIDQVPVAVS